jgi:hypothetical protein
MIIIDGFLKSITKYLLSGEINIQHMYGCSSCGYEGMLHRHGHYDRNVVTLYEHFIISIQRFLCPKCGKTYSLLPSALIPYFIYSFDVVIFCLHSVFASSKKVNDVCNHIRNLNRQCFIYIQSISFFKRRFISNMNAVNSFFAAIDSFHYDSDLSLFTVAAASILLKKILSFDTTSSFNYEYFKNMPSYFLSAR